MKALAALLLLAAAGSAGLSAPWPLALAFIPGLLASGVRRWSRSVPATTQQVGDCPACGGSWRDVARHLAFVHQETVVGELP